MWSTNKMKTRAYVIDNVIFFLLLSLPALWIIPVKSSSHDTNWWKHAVFYQIYPRSFKDSNNDGVGDVRGIIEKLDHFKNLGINGIWLSPIFQSPQIDQGYDISNYFKIHSDYGTMQDLDELISKAHRQNLKIILDFVPNHTSNQNEWFINSENGVKGFLDWYIWAEPKINKNGDVTLPNNWLSIFKGSAWTWSDKRKRYYFHQFSSAQPEINFRHPGVRAAFKVNILTFWLDRGIDGFRIDAVPYFVENINLLDEPLSSLPNYTNNDYEYLNHIYTKDQQESFEMIYEWRKLVDQYSKEKGGDERILMSESYTDLKNTMLYYGKPDGSTLGVHFTFNFFLITDLDINSTAHDIVNCIKRWLKAIPKIYVSNWVLGNHDNPRVATRLGSENVDGFNMLITILPGIANTYNGEEIGLENGEVAFEQAQDPSAQNPETFENQSRDFERTPYHWDNTANAGFNKGTAPWLPVSEKYLKTNLKNQMESNSSHYQVYKDMIKLRQNNVLKSGSTHAKAVNDNVVFIERTLNREGFILVFNKGNKQEVVDISHLSLHLLTNNSVVVKSINSKHELKKPINPQQLVLDTHESLVLYYDS